MATTTYEEMMTGLSEAKKLVEIGARYTHFKNPENTYAVIELAFMEADGSLAVVYKAEYGDECTFVRPLSSWLEQVEREGSTVPRFQKIS